MSTKPNLENALGLLAASLDDVGLRYAIIGGLAVILRGHDRATQDVDAVALGVDQRLEAFVSAANERGLTLRIPDGIPFAKANRVILLEAPDGTGIDVSMGMLPFEEDLTHRATRLEVGAGITVPVASVEDLVIMKLIAGRKRDHEDVDSLVELYPDLDRERIRGTVTEYANLLDDPEILKQLDRRL
ncbi:MAG: nucleotidyl transferase AbiEii/AbiGii toxin family protein [Fimbriimonas sp.]